MVRNPPAKAGDIRDVHRSLGREDPLEEGMATHSSILAWRIPWTEELASCILQGCKESGMTEVTQHTHTYLPVSCRFAP